MRIRIFFPAWVLFFSISLVVAAQSPSEIIMDAIKNYGEGEYKTSVKQLNDVLDEESNTFYYGDASFWLGKNYFMLENFDQAEYYLDVVISQYTDNANYGEASYLKGRILYQDSRYEDAVQILADFFSRNRKSPLAPGSLYWMGESLYELGRLEEASGIFEKIVTEYPDSYKEEASHYKLALIDLKYREAELIRLLQWSHEENLKNSENMLKARTVYEQALQSYQKKLLQLEITAGQNGAENDSVSGKEAELLRIKNELLNIKQFYLYEYGKLLKGDAG